MKKRNAAVLAVILIILILVSVYFLSAKGFFKKADNEITKEETNYAQTKEDAEEKPKNKPDLNAEQNDVTDTPEEDTEAPDTEAVETETETVDKAKSGEQNETIFEKIIYKIEDDVKTASNIQEPDSTSSGASGASAGSFWDEPLVQSVYSRFSSSEIALAMRAASGDATSAEKKAVKDMVYGRVSASEIAELQRLYNLHGGQ